MDRLQALEVFVAVADEQGFAAAARRLHLSPPAITRAVAALEDRLGVRLFQRTTRVVRLTDAGRRYLDDVRRLLAELDEADEAAAGVAAEPRGVLTVTAPVLFGGHYVMPCIVEYLQRHPQVDVQAVFLDRVVSLLEEGIDVGVRIGELPDSGLRAIRVGSVRRVLCAAPAYLERHGTPRDPADLAAHTVIAATSVSPTGEWRFRSGTGDRAVRVRPRLAVSTNDAAIEAAEQGLGVVRLLSYQVARAVAAGRLVTVMTDFEAPALPVHVLHHEGRRESAKVRAFVDLGVQRLRAALGG